MVAQIDDEVLLGLDILMMGKLGPTEIKLADKCIIWNGETIPCTLVGDLRRVRNVSLADDVTIPGLSEVIVDVYIEKDPVSIVNVPCIPYHVFSLSHKRLHSVGAVYQLSQSSLCFTIPIFAASQNFQTTL